MGAIQLALVEASSPEPEFPKRYFVLVSVGLMGLLAKTVRELG